MISAAAQQLLDERAERVEVQRFSEVLVKARFEASLAQQQQFFEKHIGPWMGRMFADLEKSETAKFYRSVGTLGRLFLEIETEAFKFAN